VKRLNAMQELVLSVLDVREGDWIHNVPLAGEPPDNWWLEVKAIRDCEAKTVRLRDNSKVLTPAICFEGFSGSTASFARDQKVKVRRVRDGWRNFHMIFEPDRSAVKPGMRDEEKVDATVWSCLYCNARGSLDGLRSRPCGHVYEPCECCAGREGTNECALDCSGVAEALSDPGIYHAGSSSEKH
jgi:hypothetical protein